MATCNPYQSNCGLTGVHTYFNPYLPDELLGTEFYFRDYEQGTITLPNGEVYWVGPTPTPQREDEMYFQYVSDAPVVAPESVPEPPIVGLILVAYFVYWLLRRS